MNLIYISPHFPPNFLPFPVEAARAGIRVLGIGDCGWYDLPEALRSSLTEYYRVDSMEDFEQMYQAVAWFCHKWGRPDRVESHNEHWLMTEARLREDFNIPGPRLADTESMRRKSLMKKRFRNAGLTVPRGGVVSTLDEAQKMMRNKRTGFGFPVVVKPDDGVGATETHKIENDEQLAEFFSGPDPRPTMMEEFVRGQLYTYDGLTDRDGNIVFDGTMVYSSGIMEVVLGQSDVYYYIDRNMPKDLADAGQRIVREYGIREKFFHFELFRREKDDEIVALEVNIRPPGGLTVDMMNYAHDFDCYSGWAKIVAGEPHGLVCTRDWYVAYVSRKDIIRYAHDLPAVRAELGDALQSYRRMPDAFRAAIGDDGFVVRSRELEELRRFIRFIHERAE